MKAVTSTIFVSCVFFAVSASAGVAPKCKSKQGNLCYAIGGTQMQKINNSSAMQRALKSMAAKLSQHEVIVYQGFRTPDDQRRIVRRLCGSGRNSCPGAASPRSSKHVVSTAADPMIRGNVVKPLCHAENQARVEHLGPRSAAAVYGYSKGYTWGHIDDATGSNYTPRNCGRYEGLKGSVAQGTPAARQKTASRRRPASREIVDTGSPRSTRVRSYKERRLAQAPKKNVHCNMFGCGTEFWFRPGFWGDQ